MFDSQRLEGLLRVLQRVALELLQVSLSAEFIGTLLLVFVGCGSCLGDAAANTVRIALCFGITVATHAQTIGEG